MSEQLLSLVSDVPGEKGRLWSLWVGDRLPRAGRRSACRHPPAHRLGAAGKPLSSVPGSCRWLLGTAALSAWSSWRSSRRLKENPLETLFFNFKKASPKAVLLPEGDE